MGDRSCSVPALSLESRSRSEFHTAPLNSARGSGRGGALPHASPGQ